MADDTDQSEKTEEPTEKKLQDAHERGDVAKSQEVNTWFVFVAASISVGLLSPSIMSDLNTLLRGILSKAHTINVDAFGQADYWSQLIESIVGILLLPLAIFAAAGIIANLVQHKIVWSKDPVTPKLSKISPLSGMKRLFSAEALMNFAKGLLKLSIVTVALVLILWPEADRLDGLMTIDLNLLLPAIWEMVLKLIAAVVIIMTVIAGADFMWQRHRWLQKQKMTLKEVRDEYKQMQGDPQIKSRIRQIRMERSRHRMMAAVPEATVVVTNPTHYAVALKYTEDMEAPVCVAKGLDLTALKIRQVAESYDIPVVENPPLARTLHASLDLEEEVPPEHYKAVAELIGYVMRLTKKKASL